MTVHISNSCPSLNHFSFIEHNIICRFSDTLLNNPSPSFPPEYFPEVQTPLKPTKKILKRKVLQLLPPKKHNFISHNSSIPQLPNQKYRYNSSRRIKIKKKGILLRSLKIQRKITSWKKRGYSPQQRVKL